MRIRYVNIQIKLLNANMYKYVDNNSTRIYVSSFEFNNHMIPNSNAKASCQNVQKICQMVKIRNMKKVFGSFPGSEVIKLISYFLPLIASTAVFGSVNSIGSTSMVSTPESGDVLRSKISVGLGIRVISSIPANEKLDSNADPEMSFEETESIFSSIILNFLGRFFFSFGLCFVEVTTNTDSVLLSRSKTTLLILLSNLFTNQAAALSSAANES